VKRKLKVKKGSSLLTLMIFMGIIITLGTALATLSVTNFKMRNLDSIQKINLYSSEAGLDEAYGLIGKLVEDAINEGNKKADEFISTLDLEDEKDKVLNGESSEYINEDGSVDEEAIKEQQKQVFQDSYKEYIENKEHTLNTLNSDVGGKYKFINQEENPKITVRKLIDSSSDAEEEDLKFADNKLSLLLHSEFQYKDVKKEIQATYEIQVPDAIYGVESSEVKLPKNKVWSNAISIDGDMNINSNDVNINGDIFVKGNEEDDNDKENGIKLNGNGIKEVNTTINGNVYSARNILFKGRDKKLNVNGNIYSENVILGKIDENGSEYGEGSILNITGDIYTTDDLELNSRNSVVNVTGGFYGVGDNSNYDHYNHSSSIIINDIDDNSNSQVNIDKDVIIGGTSYIKLEEGEPYQTGESVSIRGNYKAYTIPIHNGIGDDTKYNEENVQFRYRNPLNLIDKYNILDNEGNIQLNEVGEIQTEKFLVSDLSKYLKLYNDEFGINEDLKLSSKGINIKGNILFNTGAVVYKKNNILGIMPSNMIDMGVKNVKDKEIRTNIYYMGDEEAIDRYNIDKAEVTVTYEDNKGKVNFDDVKPNSYTKKVNQTGDINMDIREVVILNNESKNNYVFVGRNGNTAGLVGEYKVINIPNDGTFRGIIITNGDIVFRGKIDFTGTIISGGSIEFSDEYSKKITYNENYVKGIIAENYEDFKDIFKNNSTKDFESVYTRKIVALTEEGIASNISNLVKRTNWTLIK